MPPASHIFQPCRAAPVPTGPDWLHEIKHDGYRLIVQRDSEQVRGFSNPVDERRGAAIQEAGHTVVACPLLQLGGVLCYA